MRPLAAAFASAIVPEALLKSFFKPFFQVWRINLPVRSVDGAAIGRV